MLDDKVDFPNYYNYTAYDYGDYYIEIVLLYFVLPTIAGIMIVCCPSCIVAIICFKVGKKKEQQYRTKELKLCENKKTSE